MYDGMFDGLGLETLQWDWWGIGRVLLFLAVLGIWGAKRRSD